MINKKGNVRIK